MTPFLIAGGYAILLAAVLAFNRGAHRKPSSIPSTPYFPASTTPDTGPTNYRSVGGGQSSQTTVTVASGPRSAPYRVRNWTGSH